nr:nudix hydrolase 18, mitochondrial-like [Ipomoea batatas]GMC94755.1 nudix hydrolase 18, mitochondrial-like [Ipomoea batatas]GME12533.1 nudix hydrolase 18, mitochondrial-like [Ipomoea batatas]
MQTELKTAVSLAARTGRHLQRYDNGRRQVVGCVPYRYKDSGETSSLMAEDAFEVLVISPQRKSKGMLFPKGGWETDETIEAAALRETVEEAGVLGEIECKLGTWSFETKNGKNSCEGHMFPLLVKEQLDSWPEKEIRQRHWMSVREARKVCKQWWMKEALEALVGHVTKQRNAGILSAMGLSQGTLFSIRCGAQIVPPPTMASAEEA